MKKIGLFLFTLLLGVSFSLSAKISLPSVISDNMVLQQKTDAALWGTAEPGVKVTVRTGWSRNKTVVTADAHTGKWFARVKTPAAGGPYEIKISDGEVLTLKNVLIGEVWFCSGQSNMEMPMKGYGSQPAKGAAAFIVNAKAATPVRICNIVRKSSVKVLDVSEGCWEENNPETVSNTSATAYYFAEALQKAIDVPVGIIVSCWGGSTIEAWMKRDVIENDFPEFNLGHLDGTRKVRRDNQDPCVLFNGQVAPLVPYTFRGMIWYQGEANRSRPDQYVRLQTAYVRMMRDIFDVPDAPFYFVQIAPYSYDNGRKFHNGYFNEAQQKTLAVIPHSGMAVTCDIGEYGTIHPCRKQQVGERLAMLALKHDYGMSFIEADSPTYKSVTFKNGKSYVTLNVGKLGLSPMGADIPGFEVAGSDKVFHPATGRLYRSNNVIEVTCPEVSVPVSVRYCFRNWSAGGLYNNYGVPAAPFRTDDWPIGECK
ncbi:MAG: sialate O-acetylesterase [Bacteroidales bacterium]|jgi:sialate O-acetylesterase|nr:sialate O-acetylesterase [Bacteroidales bacterium]MCI1785649.1 sialate O-acetylesterase [Bacteroidales bacterium]